MFDQAQHTDAGATSFLPSDYLARKAERRTNLVYLTLFTIVIFGVVGAFFVTNRQWSSVKAQQESINIRYTKAAQQIEQLKALEAQKDQMLAKAALTTTLIEKAPRSLLLADLINRMPNKLSLLKLDLKSKRLSAPPPRPNTRGKPQSLAGRGSRASAKHNAGQPNEEALRPAPPRYVTTLVLIGVAPSHEQVSSYLAQLQESPLLKDVDLKFSEFTMIDNRELSKFRIDAKLRQDVDARRMDPLAAPGRAFGGGGGEVANADDREEN